MIDKGPSTKMCPKCQKRLTQGQWREYCKKCGYVPEGNFYNKAKRPAKLN